ncbi:MAG: RnfH family protein [Gammaproteobacteria bacterium]|jgi:putative ubiquitin-RnfH superfamily antitoxin RatB of RatAB toxin-antitoxin module
MGNAEKIPVEVAYALPGKQVIVPLAVAPDATIEQVIRTSGILEQFPDIDLARNRVGVFGKLGKLTDKLYAGDRVEIYRPLIADPKEVRKQRAAQGKVMKKGAGENSEE